MPADFKDYYEPFVGGGAFYFALPNTSKAYLNDINTHLMAAYVHIRDDLDVLIKDLTKLERTYHKLDETTQKQYFLDRREEYNALKDSNFRKTSLLIFLNKTCFNGMYRENRKGGFNVPFGKHTRPKICDTENLKLISEKLKDTKISVGSYIDAVKSAKRGDFIYFDPPYYPLNPTSSFTSYHADDFSKEDQIRLRDLFAKLDKKGCFIMLSNSNNPFIKELYNKFHIHNIKAARSINSKGSGRGKITELVITNYETR